LPIKTIADGELDDGGSTSFTLVFLLVTSRNAPKAKRLSVAVAVRWRIFGWLSGDRLTHAPNIFPAGYEFEGDKTAIS
jgi:hypothetical protein